MSEKLKELSQQIQKDFASNKTILSFQEYLDLVVKNPYQYTRNTATYLHDCVLHFGTSSTKNSPSGLRYKIFDLGSERNGPIIGGEYYQSEIIKILRRFKRQGFVNKLIALHGPNGSAKTSTIESIGHGMQIYSHQDVGAVYKFNWVFPIDKFEPMKGQEASIGFGRNTASGEDLSTYAYLDETEISCKIPSEFNENPLFLLPAPYRQEWLNTIWKKNKSRTDVPTYLNLNFLSKRNQLIFENLLNAYDGDFLKVSKHIQVERLYFSKQYRKGIASIEPQIVVDAQEKQLTYDKSITNLPSILHNMRLTEASGAIVEANRGILEYSDLLKRPIEALKYLLTTIEKSSINMPSSTHFLDLVFFATTNEKQLDAFKATPDFSSFSARTEFVSVPYLTNYRLEEKIYEKDVATISKTKKVSPHALEMLCFWSVLTRLKEPEMEKYSESYHSSIKKMTPLDKVKLYADEDLSPNLSKTDAKLIRQCRHQIITETKNSVVYEGRFGASPREVKTILNKAVQVSSEPFVSPMDIFEILDNLVSNRSVYEFLQYEIRNGYHDAKYFVKLARDEFSNIFEHELLDSLNLVQNEKYDDFLNRYLKHVVASLKNEKIYNESNSKYEDPSETFMAAVEAIISDGVEKKQFRNQIINKVAAFSLDNPNTDVDTQVIFKDILSKFKEHYYKEKHEKLHSSFSTLRKWADKDSSDLDEKQIALAEETFENLERKYGYSVPEAVACLRFLMSQKSQ